MDGQAIPRVLFFISFSATDEAFATELYLAMRHSGTDVFYAPASLRLTQDAVDEINEALDSCRVAIVIWSAGAARSPWVQNEVGFFTDRRNRGKADIVIVRIDATEVPPLLRQLQRIDLQEPRPARTVVAEILTELDSRGLRIRPDDGDATYTPDCALVSLDVLPDAVCLRLAGDLSEHAIEIKTGSRPARISVEAGRERFGARVNASNLSLSAALIEMNGALERIPIHADVLQRLRDRDADPYNLAPTTALIQRRLNEIANETTKVREALALFLAEIWKEDLSPAGAG
jgi:TIR domain